MQIPWRLLLVLPLLHCSSPSTQPPPDAVPEDAGEPDAGPPPLPPLPEVWGLKPLADINPDPAIVEVNLTATETTLELVPGQKTQVRAYNRSIPGPLLQARVGDRVIVHFTNRLADNTTIHWHGLRITDQMDGSPRIQTPVPPGGSFTYDFVVPEAGTFWYHAHVDSIHQIEQGLYGALVVHEKEPLAFTRERYLALDDVRLDEVFQIAPFNTSGPDIGRGRVGDRFLTNGVERVLAMEAPQGAVERWRILNASNARTQYLKVKGAKVRVIATDGGLLPSPVPLSKPGTWGTPDTWELAAAQRIELEVTYEGAGPVQLVSEVPYLKTDNSIGLQEVVLAEATVKGTVTAAPPVYPKVTLPKRPANAIQKPLALSGMATNTGVEFTINGMSGMNHMHMPEHFKKGQPVELTLSADVSPEHPFHLHGQFFQVVARGGVPVTDEPGLFDTVLVRGRESVTILTWFENPGRWMVHCHISEHSENGMMTEYVIDP